MNAFTQFARDVMGGEVSLAGSGDLIQPDSYMNAKQIYDIVGNQIKLSRDEAVIYPAFFRAVELTAAGLATLITESRLTVVDQDEQPVINRRTEKILEMVTWSPDDGLTPAYQFIEDLACDYCIDGNAFVVKNRSNADASVSGLARKQSTQASLAGTRSGEVYRLRDLDGLREKPYGARNVIHARFPLMLGDYNTGNNYRHGMAPRPLDIVKAAVTTGLIGDKKVLNQTKRTSNRDNVHIDVGAPASNPNVQQMELTDEQRKELITVFSGWGNSGKPLVTFLGGKSMAVDNSSETESNRKTREYELVETFRVLGTPAPLVGVQITEWGEGIEAMARFWYRFGLHNHVHRLLTPMSVRLLNRGEKFHYDETYATRGDYANIAKLIEAAGGSAQRSPIMTREEMRRLLKLLPVPWGQFVEKESNSVMINASSS